MKHVALASFAACGAAMLLAACAPPGQAPRALSLAPVNSSGAPSVAELRAATYSGLQGLPGPVTLTDGIWEGEPLAPGGVSRPSVSLAPGFRLTGDLDGDGRDEAVVVLAQTSGGSGTVNYLAVVSRAASGPRNVATALLGDRVAIRSARIEGGQLLVSVVRAGKGDAMCCPGELADLGWTLSHGTLNPVATGGGTGRLTLATLAGTEWVLRAWDIGKPVPGEPEVTLTVQGEKLSGTSGCNRYTATVKADGAPGDLSIGPVASTRMACPEPQSSVEVRVLAQLGNARKFGFLLGQLAITYELNGGSIGVMLFDARAPQGAPRP